MGVTCPAIVQSESSERIVLKETVANRVPDIGLLQTKEDIDLVVISQYFYPELISTGQLLTELMEDLAKDGRRIEVWAGHPTYYETKRVESVINYHGIVINRVWSTQFNKNSLLGKISNNISFLVSMFFKVKHIARSRSILVVTCPPLLPLIGVLTKFFGQAKVSVLIHDVYPDIAVATGYLKKNGMLARLLDQIFKYIYRHADNIIVLGRDMRDVILKKLSRQMKNKVVIIENWSDGERIRPIPKTASLLAKAENLEKLFVVLYSGNMGRFHDLEILIHAAKRLEGEDVFFLFIGGGKQQQDLENLASSIGLKNVRFLPYQPKEALPDSLTCSDISVVTLSKGVEGLAVPSKLYGILASGRPVLALLSSESEVAYVVQEGNCGIVINPRDVEGFVESIRRLKNDPQLRELLGGNARKIFEEKYDRKIIAKRFESLLFKND